MADKDAIAERRDQAFDAGGPLMRFDVVNPLRQKDAGLLERPLGRTGEVQAKACEDFGGDRSRNLAGFRVSVRIDDQLVGGRVLIDVLELDEYRVNRLMDRPLVAVAVRVAAREKLARDGLSPVAHETQGRAVPIAGEPPHAAEGDNRVLERDLLAEVDPAFPAVRLDQGEGLGA